MSNERPPIRGLLVIVAIVLAAGAILSVTAGASNPSEGTLTTTSSTTGWKGNEYQLAQTKDPALCDAPSDDVCDTFELNVDVDAAHWQNNVGGVEVKIVWPDENNDFDLFVYDESGALKGSAETWGASSERVFLPNASGKYTVKVMPYDVVDSGYDGGAHIESRAKVAPGEGDGVPDQPVSNAACESGYAGPFPCNGIDLGAFLPLDSIGGGNLNDIWGWTDPQTGKEYAVVGKTNGTSFVDVSNPTAPVYLGDLPSHQPVETIWNAWRDIKVYKNHAFIGAEEPTHGLQVFDLTQLRGVTEPKEWDETAHYSFALDGVASYLEPSTRETLNPPDNSHNIAINEDSGFLYAIGTSTCGGGGPHMVDIRDPQDPKFAGCVSEDGYTHDTQCVNYEEGDPDPNFAGREICFNSNEDTLTVVDVTDKDKPEQLARVEYEGAHYSHQGWLTEDRKQFLLDDELDEQDGGESKTKTYVFNVERLRSPTLIAEHAGEAESIDHNQYGRGNRTYQSNYRSGVRVLDVSDAASGRLAEVGFFDVYPEDDKPEFNGSWSNYPYFESGTVIATGIEQGLFVLRPSDAVMGSGAPKRAAPAAGTASRGQAEPSGGGTGSTSGDGDRGRPNARLSWVPRRISFAKFRRGLKLRARANEAVAWKFELRRGRTTLTRKSRGLAAGKRAVALKPSRRRLGKPRAFIATLRVTATDAAGNKAIVVKRMRVVK